MHILEIANSFLKQDRAGEECYFKFVRMPKPNSRNKFYLSNNVPKLTYSPELKKLSGPPLKGKEGRGEERRSME